MNAYVYTSILDTDLHIFFDKHNLQSDDVLAKKLSLKLARRQKNLISYH